MAEKEYIEREAVNALIKAECSPMVAAYLIDAVATIHAADVRPVVLCRDCKRYGGRPWENNETGICARTDCGVREDDFCSYGEKQEEI